MRKIFSLLFCAVLLLSLALPCLADGPDMTIDSLEEFLTFAEDCRLDSFSQGKTIWLNVDLDLTGVDFTPIAWFGGTLECNRHTISGLKINENGSVLGLFRYISESGIVRNLTVKGEIAPKGSREQIGGIAGSNAGVIENCHFVGSVGGSSFVGGIAGENTATGYIAGCSVSATVRGSHFVGGITGNNAGIVENCVNLGQINATAQQNQVDISDITIGIIVGTESVTSVTDIGGIAGNNPGTVRSCVNRGAVGYRQMGYNIGGIAGRHSGYLADCSNYGSICGRKDVGGIVGQAEPWVHVVFDKDTMQILKAELTVLSGRIEKLTINTENNVEEIEKLLNTLEKHRNDGEAAVDAILKPELQEPEVYLENLEKLGTSLEKMGETVRKLSGAVEEAGDDLKADVKAVADQMDTISALLENGEENVGAGVEDTSDLDTQEDVSAKIDSCINLGNVSADRNTGGILGTMSFENDLDPEDDVTVSGTESLNVTMGVRCVVTDCVNSGAVSGRKANTGGIAGLQNLGLVKQSVHAGTVAGEDHVGGITGSSLGSVRSCAARGGVSGEKFVGGIAGSGKTVTDCRSMVTPVASEKMGAVLGMMAENADLAGNLYTPLGTDPGAVDGISYDGKAQPMELEAFLALEGLPEAFLQVSVRFLFENGEEAVVVLIPGQSLQTHMIPAVPQKKAHVGAWKGLENAELDRVMTDMVFELEYVPYLITVASQEKREDKPLMLVQGSFRPDTVLTLTEVSGVGIPEESKLLNAWAFTVPEDSHVHGVRVLIPADADPTAMEVRVRREGKWEKAEAVVDGSYLAVTLECGDDAVALIALEKPIPWWHWVAVSAGAMLIVLIIVVLIVRAVGKKKKKAVEEPVAVE